MTVECAGEHTVVSEYDAATGLFTGRRIASTSGITLLANVPKGHAIIPGIHDHLSKRVDLATRTVVDYQPPSPSQDHEWNPDTKRWLIKATVAEQRHRREAALRQIKELEATQPRIVREALLEYAGAIGMLRDLDEKIAALRADLNMLAHEE